MDYAAFAVNVASSNPCVRPLLRIKISFFLLSACAEELLSAPNIITFLPSQLQSDNEKNPRESNPIPY